MPKPIIAILAGHHGIGTGASLRWNDEWNLAWEDKLNLFHELTRDGILHPVMEPVVDDMDPHERTPITRAARWAMSQKADAAIELHYNSMEEPKYSGHLVCSNRMTPFVSCMADALDVLPNRRRDTIINVDFLLPKLLDPIPCVLLEPAFIFEPIVGTHQWRPQLVLAIKHGLYKYFAGEET